MTLFVFVLLCTAVLSVLPFSSTRAPLTSSRLQVIHDIKKGLYQNYPKIKEKRTKAAVLCTNRSIQSEGAFGVIKENYKFRQFLLRGKKKVSTEITLLAIAYNINKYHSKIMNKRTGSQLHGKLLA